MTHFELASGAAEKVLKHFGLEPGPCTPERIAKSAGIFVRYYDLGGLKGFYLRLNGRDCIAVNSSLCGNEANIILAHELGHYFLHRDFTQNCLHTDYDIYIAAVHCEIEANAFAAAVLIPPAELRSLRSCSIEEAAALLRVSKELLELRLKIKS